MDTMLFSKHVDQKQSRYPGNHICEEEKFRCHLAPKITPPAHNFLPVLITLRTERIAASARGLCGWILHHKT